MNKFKTPRFGLDILMFLAAIIAHLQYLHNYLYDEDGCLTTPPPLLHSPHVSKTCPYQDRNDGQRRYMKESQTESNTSLICW